MEKTTIDPIDALADLGAASYQLCSMCGKLVLREDLEIYLQTTRCSQCQYELDTDSGPIAVL